MHLLLNMLVFVPMGQAMEQAMGTLQFSHLLLCLAVLEAILYIVLTYVLALR
jgi:membrane associated rhomboid family serine protease